MADWDPFADPADEPPEVQPVSADAEPRGRQAGEAWAPPPSPRGRPIRVACLHGTCSNSNVTRMQLQRASKLCGEAVEFIFLDGRMEAEKSNVMWEEMSRTFKGQVFYDWARFKTGPGTSVASRQYHDLDASLLYLQELLRAHEPLDGLFGFSQGANMASLLAAQAVVGQGVNFGFVVHCCPAGPGWIEQRPELFAQKLPMRSLHISGKEDSNPMLPLLSLYEDPASLAHSDGHKVIPSTGERGSRRCRPDNSRLHPWPGHRLRCLPLAGVEEHTGKVGCHELSDKSRVAIPDSAERVLKITPNASGTDIVEEVLSIAPESDACLAGPVPKAKSAPWVSSPSLTGPRR
ncbi:Rhodanese-like domain-containing protein 6 [Symbiodinium microadriaticum]|uniref:Rhodanese-like domain-containing protein 6 n=1 Tax=Symbiodinium microadriaticum TaxID=2951 RepID=A0A1Q9EKT2_SYMMI|nr:Rhodanese-like domain-containing protein 6 [Symbiodinium microadriaticum]